MSDDFSQFLNYFNQHLNQLKSCDEKVDAIFDETKKVLVALNKKIADAEEKLNTLFGNLNAQLPKMDLSLAKNYETSAEQVKENTSLFSLKGVESADMLESAILRANVAKLNLLLEAGLKSKFFIVSRVPKVEEKFKDKLDVSALGAIKKTAIKIADGMLEEITKLNAQSAIVLAKDLELNNRMQTFEAIVSELKKRFSILG